MRLPCFFTLFHLVIALFLLSVLPVQASPANVDKQIGVGSESSRASQGKARFLQFYLHFPLKEAAEEAARRLMSKGYLTTVTADVGNGRWVCIAVKRLVLRRETMLQIGRDLQSLAISLNGEFDVLATRIVK